jgi:hypothetical protein
LRNAAVGEGGGCEVGEEDEILFGETLLSSQAIALGLLIS